MSSIRFSKALKSDFLISFNTLSTCGLKISANLLIVCNMISLVPCSWYIYIKIIVSNIIISFSISCFLYLVFNFSITSGEQYPRKIPVSDIKISIKLIFSFSTFTCLVIMSLTI